MRVNMRKSGHQQTYTATLGNKLRLPKPEVHSCIVRRRRPLTNCPSDTMLAPKSCCTYWIRGILTTMVSPAFFPSGTLVVKGTSFGPANWNSSPASLPSGISTFTSIDADGYTTVSKVCPSSVSPGIMTFLSLPSGPEYSISSPPFLPSGTTTGKSTGAGMTTGNLSPEVTPAGTWVVFGRPSGRTKVITSPSLEPSGTVTSNCTIGGPSCTLKVCPTSTPSGTFACLSRPSGPENLRI
mmetsp:Transcript_16175/g.43966  ORF Transcript_16175/g.43966 Transcript_16175/m.43966 type:complete len:239 (-) Transcript_16175:203-919(-)